jgi:hypothetical protein
VAGTHFSFYDPMEILSLKSGFWYFYSSGIRSIMGCSEHIFLLDSLVLFLQEIGRSTMNHIGYHLNMTFWDQGWLTMEDLELEAQWSHP